MKWAEVVLGDVCSKIGSGATPKGGSAVYIDVGTSLIRSQNVYNLRFSYDGLAHITEDAAKKLNSVTIEEQDVLINITGDSVARTCVVPADVLPARVNQHVAIVRPKRQYLDPRFLNYYLASPYMQAFMLGLAVGKGASRNAMTKDMIAGFKVPCPPVSVQEAIVNKLSAYDDLIDNNQYQIKLLEEAAQRLYKEWFVDFRFPGHEGVEIVDGVPKGWGYYPLDEAITYYDSVRKPLSGNERASMQGEYRYYGAAGILDYVNAYLFDGTFLLLGEDGTVITEDGYPVLQYVTGQFWVNNHAHVLTGKGIYTTEFMYMMFSHTRVSDVVTGVAQPKISQGRLSAKHVLLPTEELVNRFHAATKPVFDKILLLETQVRKLSEARDRLLPKLMSGEIEL